MCPFHLDLRLHLHLPAPAPASPSTPCLRPFLFHCTCQCSNTTTVHHSGWKQIQTSIQTPEQAAPIALPLPLPLLDPPSICFSFPSVWTTEYLHPPLLTCFSSILSYACSIPVGPSIHCVWRSDQRLLDYWAIDWPSANAPHPSQPSATAIDSTCVPSASSSCWPYSLLYP